MTELTELQKREIFTRMLQQILAVEFPKEHDNPQTIYLLFPDDERLKAAFYCLQDYVGTGFSLIIERIDADSIVLKIYEPDTDDFHVCKEVLVKPNSFETYKRFYQSETDTFLSVGLLELVNENQKITPMTSLSVPIKSVEFREATE